MLKKIGSIPITEVRHSKSSSWAHPKLALLTKILGHQLSEHCFPFATKLHFLFQSFHFTHTGHLAASVNAASVQPPDKSTTTVISRSTDAYEPMGNLLLSELTTCITVTPNKYVAFAPIPLYLFTKFHTKKNFLLLLSYVIFTSKILLTYANAICNLNMPARYLTR